MKKNQDYFTYPNYCLRMPSLPINRLFALNERIAGTNLDDRDAVLKLIDELFGNPTFREAIFTSSMDLYKRLLLLKQKENTTAEELKGFLISFYKYYSRMSHRCTPYGVFAGLSAGDVTPSPTAFTFAKDQHTPVFQFNIQTITQFLRHFDALDPSVINRLRYYANNTLYIMKDKLFYVEKIDQNGEQISNLSSITLNIHIRRILDRAANGATVTELADTIVLDNVTPQQKIGFVNNLIASQVLISELWPGVSSGDFMRDFLEKADKQGISNDRIDELKAFYELFRNSKRIEDIRGIREFLDACDETSISKMKDFYRVDLFHNMEKNELNAQVIRRIKDISYELMLISSIDTPISIETFKRNFFARYESREVPLVHALDPNYGVGYALAVNGISEYTPLIDGIPIAGAIDNRIPVNRRMEAIRSRAKKAFYEKGETVVNIDGDLAPWIAEVKENRAIFDSRAMTSIYTFGSLSAPSVEELDKGNFRFRPTQVSSPYAGRLLSRFLHGDPKLDGIVKEIARREQAANPDVILAEAVYIPDGKYANINLTTQLRDYEITYSSTSKLDPSHQINVNDLMVSVRNGRVVLRSLKLNKEIIPCITGTYDVSFANPIYQFLSDVSYQNVNHGFEWSWGPFDYDEPFLPRIEYRNFVLQRARWFIPKTAINYKSQAAIDAYFDKLVPERRLPRYVIIPEGDNELLIDLENPVCRAILAKEINRTDTALQEFLNTGDQCFIRNGSDIYTNEIIVPFGTDKPMFPQRYDSEVRVKDEVRRIFPPGSEWAYFKIYSGTKILEDLLTEVIAPFTRELTERGTIDRWFFIRYNDPGYHIRLRVHRADGDHNEDWYRITEELQRRIDQFMPEEHTVRLALDTYQREIERYGAHAIEASEALFCADSIATTEFLDLISGNEGETLRWKFALVSIDTLLDDFDYTLEEKQRLLGALSTDFFNEFTVNSPDKGKIVSRELRDRYRANKAGIADMLRPELRDPELAEGYACFETRSAAIAGNLPVPGGAISRDELLASFIHMSMNRLFIANQRKHELVIYYSLKEFYTSAIAQQKYSINEYAGNSH